MAFLRRASNVTDYGAVAFRQGLAKKHQNLLLSGGTLPPESVEAGTLYVKTAYSTFEFVSVVPRGNQRRLLTIDNVWAEPAVAVPGPDVYYRLTKNILGSDSRTAKSNKRTIHVLLGAPLQEYGTDIRIGKETRPEAFPQSYQDPRGRGRLAPLEEPPPPLEVPFFGQFSGEAIVSCSLTIDLNPTLPPEPEPEGTMTLLQLVNRVLLRLREDAVTTLDDEYSKLIAAFIADTHGEVIAAHDWTRLDRTVVVKLQPGKTEYSLYEGSDDLYPGSAAPITDSLIRYLDDVPLAALYSTYADLMSGNPLNRMNEGSVEQMLHDIMTRGAASARPSTFSISAHAAEDGLTLNLDTDPDAEYLLAIRMHRSEEAIDPTTDINRTIRAPILPIVLGATFLALNERGEELGEPGALAERRFANALGNAIESDRTRQQKTNGFEFYRS